MEQARYWMCPRRTHNLNDHILESTNPLYGDSWEEQAFAEDAGHLGGCIWPPRSYFCSFCRREFRSAQALGGHMNVHRRDRARLKQSPTPHNEILHHDQNKYNPILEPFSSFDVQFPSQICSLINNPNPNPDSDCDHGFFESSFSPTRVQVSSTLTNGDEYNKRASITSSPSRSNFVGDKNIHSSDCKSEEKKSKTLELMSGAKRDYVTADLSISLSLVVSRTNLTSSGAKEEAMRFKRRRIDEMSSPFFSKLSAVDRHNHLPHNHQPDVLALSPSSVEDLDLELRLG